MVPWGRTCVMRTSLTWGDVVMAVDSQVSIWHWLWPLRTKRNMYAKYNQVVSNLLPVSLKCFLGRCGHSPRVSWCVSGCALGETATEDSSCFILNSSLDQPRKRFSRGWAVLNGYSPSSILPTGIWKGRPVPITLNQAFAMTSLRLTEEDRKGGDMTLPSAPLAVAGTAEEICESELIQAVESNPVTPAAK